MSEQRHESAPHGNSVPELQTATPLLQSQLRKASWFARGALVLVVLFSLSLGRAAYHGLIALEQLFALAAGAWR